MVTWGTNTVHTVGATTAAAAPAAPPAFGAAPAQQQGNTGGFSFSSPQPASGGGIFGGGFTGAGAATAPANSGVGIGLFGSSTPAPSGGLFGSLAPAPTGGSLMFGSTTPSTTASFGAPASATGGGLFGSPAPPGGGSLFGSMPNTNTSMFGFAPASANNALQQQQQQQQQQQPQIPAHAALQAHMDASARNEEARVIQRMQAIHQAYTGTVVVVDNNNESSQSSHCFSTALYNPVTPQQRQLQAAHSSMMLMSSSSIMNDNNNNFGQLFAPPKPPQMGQVDWDLACVRNPDSQNFMPVAVVGAESLLARGILHQEQADTIAKHVAKIRDAAEQLQQRNVKVRRQLEVVAQKHQTQLARLLKVMKHVEVARCFNLPLQPAEMEAQSRILHLKRNVVEGQLVPTVSRLSNPQLLLTMTTTTNNALAMQEGGGPQISQEQQQQWMLLMKEHRSTIAKMTESLQKEQRDLQLIQQRVLATETIAGRPHARLF